MFSRMGLIRGTSKYADYYGRHPELRAEDDRVRESTRKMMARIFGVEPERLRNRQRTMAVVQKLMNWASSLKLATIEMDASDMPILYGISTDDEIIRGHVTAGRPALIAARAMNRAACRQRVSRHRVKTAPREMTATIKELALA